MGTHKTRLTIVTGTALALVVAGSAAVAAHPGGRDRDGDRGFARGQVERGAERGAFGDRSPRRGGALGAMRGGALGGMRGLTEDFERRETTLQTTDGTSVRRVEQGTVDSASDTGLTYSLASGEIVTVVIDDDTQAVALSEQEVTDRRGWSRTRMLPSEVEVAGIEAGTEIIVWSDAEDGGDFTAQRIVVQPDGAAIADAEDGDGGDAADAATLESLGAPVVDA
jgi:hypothetical protein